MKIAMDSGKKVIAAGPGNPPVVVDETAEIRVAAGHIVNGASLDNNIVCICEKEVLAVDGMADLQSGSVQPGYGSHPALVSGARLLRSSDSGGQV